VLVLTGLQQHLLDDTILIVQVSRVVSCGLPAPQAVAKRARPGCRAVVHTPVNSSFAVNSSFNVRLA
jgi:hypothetical protein